jgi:predicted aspartyl protease
LPHFTLQISPHGPILTAFIGVSVARQDALKAAGQTIPSHVQIQALVDTGASATCLDPSVLKTLNLTPTGSATVETPSTEGTPVIADQYDVSIVVPPAKPNQFPLIRNTLPVISVKLLSSFGYHALIGRDILGECVLFYNGDNGWFTLAY